MVLSNENRQHLGRMNGKNGRKRTSFRYFFFNNEGDECGGLVFKTKEKDGKIIFEMSFTMDNYKDDQAVQILNDEYYSNAKAYIKRGISINQYSVGSIIDERNNKLKKLSMIEDGKERTEKLIR
ncbi:hypothetical protein Q4512_03685 [Oceanihabitans sp. 2_MG-2023]|uniref:hypothetical protein n=1 Tax=Oceanihabitans sp. 2_MG-2023 TaxID=3062661 RepID=UPI0026E2B2D3|nr:hypothetical protein [Oceanihabitans sp. 2_MG-2023]MDO6596001.1 hypothetical protein [Oceanihabitans sp. 2_MG-2023]